MKVGPVQGNTNFSYGNMVKKKNHDPCSSLETRKWPLALIAALPTTRPLKSCA